MKRVKGCLNKKCRDYRKIHYKESDKNCAKCGTKLSYVCPDCFKKIPDNVSDKYCRVHIAERQDKKEKRTKNVRKYVGWGLLIAGTLTTVTKCITDITKKK